MWRANISCRNMSQSIYKYKFLKACKRLSKRNETIVYVDVDVDASLLVQYNETKLSFTLKLTGRCIHYFFN